MPTLYLCYTTCPTKGLYNISFQCHCQRSNTGNLHKNLFSENTAPVVNNQYRKHTYIIVK